MCVPEFRDEKKSQQSLRQIHGYRPKALKRERSFLVVSPVDYPIFVAARQTTSQTDDVTERGYFFRWLDDMTSFCSAFACSSASEIHPDSHCAKVVYPVERYSDYAALDAARLLQQRRYDVRHQLFRPISEDDDSRSHSNTMITDVM
jgi:hypothetical protein